MAQALMTSPSTALNGLHVPARAAISFFDSSSSFYCLRFSGYKNSSCAFDSKVRRKQVPYCRHQPCEEDDGSEEASINFCAAGEDGPTLATEDVNDHQEGVTRDA